jgi:hypothetical protein
MTKVAIMQPYYLPYIGYWKLINNVDIFIILDNVNMITRGWISRNRYYSKQNHVYNWLTIPLIAKSQNKLINEHFYENRNWCMKHRLALSDALRGAPFREQSLNIFDYSVADPASNTKSMSTFLTESISRIARVLEIDTSILCASRLTLKGSTNASELIIGLCKEVGASAYINLPSGVTLYDEHKFEQEGIALSFQKFSPNEGLKTLNDDDCVEARLPANIIELIGCNCIKSIQLCLE